MSYKIVKSFYVTKDADFKTIKDWFKNFLEKIYIEEDVAESKKEAKEMAKESADNALTISGREVSLEWDVMNMAYDFPPLVKFVHRKGWLDKDLANSEYFGWFI